MGVAAMFSKMTTELASVYQIVVPGPRARQIGSALAGGMVSVLGAAYASTALFKLIPGAGMAIGGLIQAPIVAAVSYAAGEVLKDYFKKAKAGKELTVIELKDSFIRTLSSKVGIRTTLPMISGDQGFCAYCGGKLVTGGAFCPGCGHRAAA